MNLLIKTAKIIDVHSKFNQKKRDIRKYKICSDLGINLIIIPYQYSYLNPTDLEEFIYAELNKIC